MDQLDVAVLVCTYRRPEQLAVLLQHLQAQVFRTGRPRIAVLVVDNSPDGEAASVAGRSTGPLPVHYRPHGAGNIASGRNATLAWARDGARFVAMIDDDEVPEPDWLQALLEAQAASGADVVTGPVLARYPAGAAEWLQRDDFFSVVGPAGGAFVEEAVSGNALVSCELVNRLGLCFDESLGSSGGEDQLFFRAARAGGGLLWYAPEARVHEVVPEQRLSARYLLRREYRKGNTLGLLDRSRPGWPAGRPRRRLLVSGYWMLTGVLRAVGAVLRRDRAAAVAGGLRGARGLGMLSGLRGRTFALYGGPVARRPTIALVLDEDPHYQSAGHSHFLRGFVSHYEGLGAQVVIILTAPRLAFLVRRTGATAYSSPALWTVAGLQVAVAPKAILAHLAWRAFRAAPRGAQRAVDHVRTSVRSRRDVDHRLGAWLSAAQQEAVTGAFAQWKPDAVLFSGLFSVPAPLRLPASVRSTVLVTHDVVSERAEQFRARGVPGLTCRLLGAGREGGARGLRHDRRHPVGRRRRAAAVGTARSSTGRPGLLRGRHGAAGRRPGRSVPVRRQRLAAQRRRPPLVPGALLGRRPRPRPLRRAPRRRHGVRTAGRRSGRCGPAR
jgi:succinoglycan biosynthesis protein ExoM